MSKEIDSLSFDLPKNQSNVIKVIGVGGGGSNAVNHMCQKGIKGVDFVICNTDAQALKNSPVPTKIQLGVSLTEGLGAGANPEVGEQAAIESIDDIKKMFGTHTKMVFITVGMGGGTGTGAAPIIAKVAKEMDLLTVGIVTIPFSFEGKMRNEQAQKGIEKLREYIDSLVVINNNKLREVYGNLGFKAGFSKADEVLSTAASGIAEVITHHYTQNIDLKDAKTVLASSGTAIMGSASATGSNRAQEAITKALDSPLLNDNRITGAKNVLLLIVSGTTEITIDEIGEINDYIQSEAKSNVDIIMGVGEDESLGEAIAVTVIATGFNIEQQMEISSTESKKIVHNLGDETKFEPGFVPKGEIIEEKVIKYTLEEVEDEIDEPLSNLIATSELIKNIEVDYEEVYAENIGDFVITPIAQKEAIVEDEIIEEENQVTLTFDLPLSPKKQAEKEDQEVTTHELIAKIDDINVVEAEHIEPERTPDGKIKYGLEDFVEKETKTVQEATDNELEDEELKFDVRVENSTSRASVIVDGDEASPLNLTIAELQKKADERREKMKEFNYKFTNRINQNIEEIENQPAYKRMGVDLEDVEPSSEVSSTDQSRTSLDVDDNNDIQLRSNNSFLHDNVD
ncbi:MAG: cell division protein FtsZ [Flavobacteriaceae bacterium]|nr:cell division protein FtsZ [Flavobacteriaceae bacterium]